MLCGFFLHFKNLRKKKRRNWRDFKVWVPEMSYNVALLKNIPITVLSKQVCFLLFYLCCEAKGTRSLLRDEAPHSTQWRKRGLASL